MKPGAVTVARRRKPGAQLARDTDATAFTVLLSDLVGRIPGAHAAALVDRDGEAIDYAGDLSPFDVKVAGAHWQIVLGELDRVEPFRRPRHVVVRGELRSFVLRALDDAYAVVLILRARAGFAHCPRAFGVFERALHGEAGIGKPQRGPAWTPVVVQRDARSRPRAIGTSGGGELLPVEVLGAVMGLGRSERGYRIRTATGVEATVVREPGGTWYADEPLELLQRSMP